MRRQTRAFFFLLLASITGAVVGISADLTLWYRQPAAEWNEALPIGNGRLGAMIFGGIKEEYLQLNEDSIWYGGPRDRNNPDALRNLGEIRRLLRE